MANVSSKVKVSFTLLLVAAAVVATRYGSQKQQQNTPLNDSRGRKRRSLRGLAISSPLNGFAFGEGSGVAFAFGNVAAKSSPGGGVVTSKGVSAGGGFGGGLGYVDSSVGSAYGGGSGGGNVTSAKSEYGLTEGASTYAINGATSNSTFGGQSVGAGRGKGVFGGMFNFTPVPEYYYYYEPGQFQFGSFGNKTGGGGGGITSTGVQTKGYFETLPFLGGYAGGTGSVSSAAAGYGFGGGSLPSGNKTTSAGGAGGGDVLSDAFGFASAGLGQVLSEAEFNATGDGVADGGGYGYIGEENEESGP